MLDFKRFPLDLARVLGGPFIHLAIRPKYIYVGEKAKDFKKYKEGAIVVAPHICFGDPMIVSSAIWYRRMGFMVADFIMKKQPRGFFLKIAGCIGVGREIVDIEAIKKTVGLLEKGRVIGIFAEGHINRENDIPVPYKMGSSMMASQAGVPILPIYFKRRKHWWNRYRIAIGEMVYPKALENGAKPSMKDIKEMNDEVYKRTLELREEYLKCVKKKYLRG